MKAKIYSTKGEEKGNLELRDEVFAVAWNPNLVSDVVRIIEGNMRKGTAHAKDRSEVRGGGKKPWRQKGTGRARHGSIRSPIWRGGGVTFGPRNEKDYSRKINRKARLKALASGLSKKLDDDEVIFVEDLSIKEPKTAQAKEFLAAIAGVKNFETILSKRKNSVLIVIEENDENLKKSFSNFANVKVVEVRNLNVLNLIKHKHTLFLNSKESISKLNERFGIEENKSKSPKKAKAPAKTKTKTKKVESKK